MAKTRYAADKPQDCKDCHFWGGRNKGCILKEENCYYLLPEKEVKKSKSPCEGCAYGRNAPCVGFCMRKILAESKKKGGK